MPTVNAGIRAILTARFGNARFGASRFGFVPRDREEKAFTGDPIFYRHQEALQHYTSDQEHEEVETP